MPKSGGYNKEPKKCLVTERVGDVGAVRIPLIGRTPYDAAAADDDKYFI